MHYICTYDYPALLYMCYILHYLEDITWQFSQKSFSTHKHTATIATTAIQNKGTICHQLQFITSIIYFHVETVPQSEISMYICD